MMSSADEDLKFAIAGAIAVVGSLPLVFLMVGLLIQLFWPLAVALGLLIWAWCVRYCIKYIRSHKL